MLDAKAQSILVFLILLALLLLNTGHTDADIFAERNVKNNRFSATTLSFSQNHTANATPLTQLFQTAGLLPGGFDLGAVRIKKEGKMNFKYRVKAIKKGGDDNLCSNLTLRILKDGSFIYQDKLLNLSIDHTVENNNAHDWIFFIELNNNDPSLKNKICQFDFYFKTWRDDPDSRKGLYAERRLYNTITTGIW
jgi:hypothetical protein